MIARRISGLRYLISVANILVATTVFWGGILVGNVVFSYGLPYDFRYAVYSGIVAVALVFDHFRCEGSRGADSADSARGGTFSIALRQTITAYFILLLYFSLTRDAAVSRLFLIGFAPALLLALWVSNRFSPLIISNWLLQGTAPYRMVVIRGSGNVSALRRWLIKRARLGFKIVGMVGDCASSQLLELPRLGALSDLQSVITEYRINVIVHVGFIQDGTDLRELQRLCDSLGVRLIVSFALKRRRLRSVNVWEDGGLHFLTLREEPLECPSNRILKRTVDMVISLPVVILVLPALSIGVWIFQRWQSPGPLFFMQERAGINGSIFQILKFRTMHVENPNEVRQASQGDPRIYPLGRILRKLSLDEFPQFINVLKGDMSIVGPRPHLSVHDDVFSRMRQDYRVRSLIKPGITGFAQVRGFRGETVRARDVIKRAQADIYYVENWTIWLDISIILRTFGQLLKTPTTAY